MTQEVRLLIGIPGSGKSTWIEQEVQRLEDEHRTTCTISRDNIRKSMLNPGEDYFVNEKEVFNEFVKQINEAMEVGIDIVFVDATHINIASRRKVLSKLNPDPSTNLVLEIMDTSVRTALERNSHRIGFARVPDSAIHSMARNFRMPTVAEFADANCYGFNKVYIKHHKSDDTYGLMRKNK